MEYNIGDWVFILPHKVRISDAKDSCFTGDVGTVVVVWQASEFVEVEVNTYGRKYPYYVLPEFIRPATPREIETWQNKTDVEETGRKNRKYVEPWEKPEWWGQE